MFEVFVLSVLQGIAEFLPISSSGHLVLGKHFLGLADVGIRLDIFLHVGTLVAIFVFYASIVLKLLRGVITFERGSWGYLARIVLSAIPAGVVGLLFKDQLETLFSSVRMVGFALLFTGVVLTLTKILPRGERKVGVWGAISMGVAQAIAILPGVSRSGMTLVAARIGKIGAAEAAEFSFLMSAPPIAGAALLEVMKSLKAAEGVAAANEVSWTLCALGALVAAVVGYFSLKILLSSLKSDRFWLFGPYCFLAGLLAVLVP